MKFSKLDLLVLFVFALVPLLCVIVYSLPLAVQVGLAAQGNIFDPAHFVSSVFVHGNVMHLVGNLVGFLIFGVLLFFLNKLAGTSKFLLYALGYVIVLVPLFYGCFVWVFRDVIFLGVLSDYYFGLSLVVGGLMGLILPSMLNLLHTELQNKFNRASLFFGLLFFTGALIIKAYLNTNLLYWIFFAFLSVAGFVLLFFAFYKVERNVRQTLNKQTTKLTLALFTITTYILLMPGLFPTEIILPNMGTVNIFAHYFAVTLGTLPGIYLVVYETKKLNLNK